MWRSVRLFPAVPGKASHPLGKPTGILQKFLSAVFACPNFFLCSRPGLSSTHEAADAPDKGQKGLFICSFNNKSICGYSLPQRKEQMLVSTGGLSTAVFLQGFAQRRAACPSSRGSLGSLLSSPQNSIAVGIRGGKGKQRAHRGWMLSSPHHQAAALVRQPRVEPSPCALLQAWRLRSHPPPAPLWLPGLKPVQLQPRRKQRRALLQPLAIYLPQNIPPGKFSLLCWTKLSCNSNSSETRFV